MKEDRQVEFDGQGELLVQGAELLVRGGVVGGGEIEPDLPHGHGVLAAEEGPECFGVAT